MNKGQLILLESWTGFAEHIGRWVSRLVEGCAVKHFPCNKNADLLAPAGKDSNIMAGSPLILLKALYIGLEMLVRMSGHIHF